MIRRPICISLIFVFLSIGATSSFPAEYDVGFPELTVTARKLDSSLGRLVRRSQLIVQAVVESQRDVDESSAMVFLRVERHILGNAVSVGKSLPVQLYYARYIPPQGTSDLVQERDHLPLYTKYTPSVGARGIFFITKKWVDVANLVGRDANVDTLVGQELPRWQLIGEDRGVIEGDQARLEEFTEVIRGYIRWYRSHEATPMEHAHFLANYSASNDERLHEDFKYDRMLFSKELPTATQDELLSDDDFPTVIRSQFEHMRSVLERSIQKRSRAEFEAEFAEYDWENMISSGDDEQVRQAIRFLNQFTSDELRSYHHKWAPALRDLLESDDPELRLRVASRLGLIHDRARIPVLIDGLRYESEIPFKRTLLIELQRATGQSFPFDPGASEEIREAQIAVWEEWWASQLLDE